MSNDHPAEGRLAYGDELSGDELRYVGPCDGNALPEQASNIDNKCSDDEAQGELFPVDADDDAYDWDEAGDDGTAPRVARDVKTPTAQ